jgi:hypothetical protein
VSPGTYNERIDNHSKAITIESTGGAAVTTINGGGAGGSVVTLNANTGETPVLRGFTVTNGYSQFDGGGVTTGGGPALIENNIVTGNHDCAGTGGIKASSSSATIRGNTIANNGRRLRDARVRSAAEGGRRNARRRAALPCRARRRKDNARRLPSCVGGAEGVAGRAAV